MNNSKKQQSSPNNEKHEKHHRPPQLINSQTMPTIKPLTTPNAEIHERYSYLDIQSNLKNPLKLYGPLKISRSQLSIREQMDNTFNLTSKHQQSIDFARKKWTYFTDTDNKWNNPDWCKSRKVMDFYHDDKLRRDCMSLDS